jgi:tetratricopeptide (TPR) repeat protein
LFTLLALWVDAGTDAAAGTGSVAWRYAVILLAFTAALLSRASAVTLIPLLMITDFFFRCSRRWSSFVSGLRGRRGVLYVLMALNLVGYAAWAYHVQHGLRVEPITEQLNPLVAEPPGIRWLNALVIAGRYLWLFVVPLHVSADYAIGALPVIHTVLDGRLLASAIAVVGLIVVAAACWRRASIVTWGLLFAACAYVLFSNVLAPAHAMMAERWMYLPCAGLCAAVSFLAAALLARVPGRTAIGSALTALLLLAFGTRTVLRNRDWHDMISIWSATLRVAPNSFRAHNGLGYAYFQARRYGDAAGALEQAASLFDKDPSTYNLLGASYEALSKPAKAAGAYRHLLALWPDAALNIHHRIGLLELRQPEKRADAVRELKQALQLAPNSLQLKTDLARAYYLDGDIRSAKPLFEAIRDESPNYPDAYIGLAGCAQVQKKYEEAAQNYLKALSLGASRSFNLQQSFERALASYVVEANGSESIARRYAQDALRYFPASRTFQQLAAANSAS